MAKKKKEYKATLVGGNTLTATLEPRQKYTTHLPANPNLVAEIKKEK